MLILLKADTLLTSTVVNRPAPWNQMNQNAAVLDVSILINAFFCLYDKTMHLKCVNILFACISCQYLHYKKLKRLHFILNQNSLQLEK